ncbi:MAG: hypothetical protein K2Y32_02480 [Candidatus Obscuribacterales bacterium]|nr:hypothetical protein [Candidatus Obscuribacterales bacterium]
MKLSPKYLLSISGALALTFTSTVSLAFAQDAEVQDREIEVDMIMAGLPAAPMPPAIPIPGAIAIDAPAPEPVVMAWGRHSGPGAGGPGGCPAMRGLFSGEHALTDDQYEKLYSLKNSMLDKVGPKMVELHSLERQLKDAITRAEIDSKKAGELKGKITSLKSDLASIKIDNQIAFMEILTADQRKDMRQAMVKGPLMMMGKMGHSRHKMPHRPR